MNSVHLWHFTNYRYHFDLSVWVLRKILIYVSKCISPMIAPANMVENWNWLWVSHEVTKPVTLYLIIIILLRSRIGAKIH